jgi:outer membrane protein TolC
MTLSLLFSTLSVADPSLALKVQSTKNNLPSPLDLKSALSVAGNRQHPDIQIALAEISQVQSEQSIIDAQNSFQLGAFGQLAGTIPSDIIPDDYKGRNTDHEVNLEISKRLFDFGRSSNQYDAFEKLFLSANTNLVYQKKLHYLQILTAFLEVILADLKFSYNNEAMSLVYIQFDRAKIHHKQKKISDLELLRIENNYSKSSLERTISENKQRIKRSLLAIVLDSPSHLPSDLQEPDFSAIADLSINRELAEIDVIQNKVQQHNLQLKKLSLEIDAEKKRQQSFYANKYPIITGRLGAGWYSRELGGDDKVVAALMLEVPIYQGGEVDARVNVSLAKLTQLQATYSKLKMELNQQVLESWMQLKNLKQQYKQVMVELNYRELYLDKSRIEYDSELKADLGNAMVFLSHSQLAEKQVLFQIAILWTKLDIMMGKETLYGMD